MLGRWADGTNESSTKRLMFQVLLFFHDFLQNSLQKYFQSTPGPHLMRIHLVQYSTSARYEKYSSIHLVRPIIHFVRFFALSTS